MKNVILGLGAVASATAAVTLFGTATATAAPDVSGETYSDATDAIDEDGGKPIVATRVGDKLDQGDCIVTTVSDASFLRIDASDDGEVLLSLNCAGGYATATNPGASVASPMGRAAKSKAEEEAAEEEASLEEVSEPEA